MSCLTKAFYHTGTITQTNIGPATKGALHSVTYSLTGASDTITIRDGSTIIFVLTAGATSLQNQFGWKGVRLDGQLSVELSNSGIKATIEMSESL